jgi:hypothetical protein
MKRFAEAATQKYERRLCVHLNRFFPEECAALGELKIRDTVRYSIHRATTHGFVSERDVCKFVDVMFILGREFDEDQSLPWARTILSNNEVGEDPTLRIERLCWVAQQFLMDQGTA